MFCYLLYLVEKKKIYSFKILKIFQKLKYKVVCIYYVEIYVLFNYFRSWRKYNVTIFEIGMNISSIDFANELFFKVIKK